MAVPENKPSALEVDTPDRGESLPGGAKPVAASENRRKLVLPDGTPVSEMSVIHTPRSRERTQEDVDYVPVIIKRTDEGPRHPDDTLERAIAHGLEQLKRAELSLALSSLAAGLIVGFSALAVGVVTTALLPLEQPAITRLAQAAVYPLGFIICILSGNQLYTEHTATALYPVLDRKAPVGRLLKLWAIVIAGNLLGAAAVAGLLTIAEDVVGAAPGYAMIGEHLVRFEFTVLLTSAVLAGWLMALGAWLVLSSYGTSSRIMAIYIVTALIGLGGLHHSIAGAAEMFTALFATDEFTAGQAVRFISGALLGNLIGGSLFVGVLNYAHIRHTQADD